MLKGGKMKIKTLLVLTSLFGIIFGLVYLLFPKYLLDFFGVDQTDAVIMTTRFFGGSIFGYGVLAWSARNAAGSETRRAIKLALFIASLIGSVLSILGVTSGFFNTLGWIPVAFFAVLTIAFGYFRFVKPEKI
jgi:Na+-driven multidrug efflux pump